MRSDMDKVITERPRAGGGIRQPKGELRKQQRIPLDEQPKREKIRAKWQQEWQCKEFTDLIGPLRRYVLKQVGRPWNKVYSEIKSVLRGTGMSSIHAIGHLWDFIERHVVLKDKKPYIVVGMFDRSTTDDGLVQCHSLTYVCPKTGLLKKNPFYREGWLKFKPKLPLAVEVDGKHYLKWKDVWYQVEISTIPERPKPYHYTHRGQATWDVFLGATPAWYNNTLEEMYGKNKRGISKRQLNKREIKKLKLNDGF